LGLVLCKWWGKYDALGFVLGVALFAWAVGWLMHYSFRASRVVLTGIILGVLGTGLFFLTAGGNYLLKAQENFDSAVTDSISYYKEQGVDEEKLSVLRETMNQLSSVIRTGFPAIIVIAVTTFVNFNYFLARRLLSNLRYMPQSTLSTSQWRTPDRFIWVFIVSGFAIWAGRAMALDFLYRVGLNFMILMLATYLVQGFILVNFFLKKWKWPVFSQIFLYMVLVFQPLFLIMIILWGIFEVWFNFRKLELKG